MITQDEAIALARKVKEQGAFTDRKDVLLVDIELFTALCNAVRKQTLLEAAEWFGARVCEWNSEEVHNELRQMAGE